MDNTCVKVLIGHQLYSIFHSSLISSNFKMSDEASSNIKWLHSARAWRFRSEFARSFVQFVKQSVVGSIQFQGEPLTRPPASVSTQTRRLLLITSKRTARGKTTAGCCSYYVFTRCDVPYVEKR